MIKLYEGGAYLVNGTDIIEDGANQEEILKSKIGSVVSKEEIFFSTGQTKHMVIFINCPAHRT